MSYGRTSSSLLAAADSNKVTAMPSNLVLCKLACDSRADPLRRAWSLWTAAQRWLCNRRKDAMSTTVSRTTLVVPGVVHYIECRPNWTRARVICAIDVKPCEEMTRARTWFVEERTRKSARGRMYLDQTDDVPIFCDFNFETGRRSTLSALSLFPHFSVRLLSLQRHKTLHQHTQTHIPIVPLHSPPIPVPRLIVSFVSSPSSYESGGKRGLG